MTLRESWDDFCEWYNVSGSIYIPEKTTAWSVWQTILAYNEKERNSNEA